ncbi:DUF1156 domain-containing protein [Thermofilum pendens]|uniref:DUF1156 domain-containing protein n=1 Tax=Thermofilum pendens (strain DSM 2475 / Hrk 5) TaxID=368408 RepID=A1RYV2_THEPD|nr:DUF1156 domain-containing protein [Thermofilum pendens]ABL78382.1 protein of unknown function DUF1156 [Thermofilum pendens Hrk 5]
MPEEKPTLLESPSFPIESINKASKSEKTGGGRPPYWEMVFWWTRKPLAGARAIIAASLLSQDDYPESYNFLKDLFPCMDKRTPHSCNPNQRLVEKLKGKKLLDPFAGFGSIPLEAARLGLDVTAVELLPTAYVFLKAVLEYPKEYGKRLIEISGKEVESLGLRDAVRRFNGSAKIIETGRYKVPLLIYDVARWGRWVTEELKKDPDFKELYDEDVAVYIGTWEIKCPVCGRYTPLVGNWWLARVKSKRGYERLAWMQWRDGEIEVVDLNEACKKTGRSSCNELLAKVQGKDEESGARVEWNGQVYVVPSKNINAKLEEAQCLYCRAKIDHRVKENRILKPVKNKKKEGEWYVKWALQRWNSLLEDYLFGKVSLEELRNAPARPRILVKVRVTDGDLEFEPATREDTEKLWKALEKLKQKWKEPDVPSEELWKYTASGGGALSIWTWGFDKFYKLFNPRQLLTLVKLVRLVREAGKSVEEEKLKEGWSKEDSFRYAEAITTYLAIALCKQINYDSIVTSTEPVQKFIRETLAFRGIAMTWNWVEELPVADVLGSYIRSLNSSVGSLSYLVSAVYGSPSRVKVLLDDATTLDMLVGEKFDLIVTDPPYADDVPYTELSDFYYVWLKRALSDVSGGKLIPRFLPEAFFDEFGEEIKTQWETFATREVSENTERWKYFKLNISFSELLARAFANVTRFLDEKGLLVTYYVAKKPEAWVALIDALWHINGMRVVVAYPVVTEAEENVVARGRAAVMGGYVMGWRRREVEKPLDLSSEKEAVVTTVSERLGNYLKAIDVKEGATAWVYAYLAALSYLTSFYPVKDGGVELDAEGVVSHAMALSFEAMLRKAGVNLHDPAALAYLALRVVEDEKGRVDSDVLSRVALGLGIRDVELVKLGLVREVRSGGPKVAKRKVFEVMAPRNETVDEVRRVLYPLRGKAPVLECFRNLQLSVLARTQVSCDQRAREEAKELAKAIVRLSGMGLIDEEDPDVRLSRAVLGFEWWEQ